MSVIAEQMSPALRSFLDEQGLKELEDKLKGGTTALHLAARHNRLDLLEEILQSWKNIDIPDDNCATPLLAALDAPEGAHELMFARLQSLGATTLFNHTGVVVEPKRWYFIFLKMTSQVMETEGERKEEAERYRQELSASPTDVVNRINKILGLSQTFQNDFKKKRHPEFHEKIGAIARSGIKTKHFHDKDTFVQYFGKIDDDFFSAGGYTYARHVEKLCNKVTTELKKLTMSDDAYILPYYSMGVGFYLRVQKFIEENEDLYRKAWKFIKDQEPFVKEKLWDSINLSFGRTLTYLNRILKIFKPILGKLAADLNTYFRDPKSKNIILNQENFSKYYEATIKDLEETLKLFVERATDKLKVVSDLGLRQVINDIIKGGAVSESEYFHEQLTTQKSVDAGSIAYCSLCRSLSFPNVLKERMSLIDSMISSVIANPSLKKEEILGNAKEFITESFVEVRSRERQFQNENEANQRMEQAKRRYAAEQEANVLKIRQAEERETKKKVEALRTYVMTSIANLDGTSLSLLKQILDPKMNTRLQLDIKNLHGLVEQIHSFKVEPSDKGFILKFDNKPITSYHRQHGKPLDSKVIKEVFGIFKGLNISLADLEVDLKADAQKALTAEASIHEKLKVA